MHSADLTKRNVEKIAELFPTAATETLDADGNLNRGIDFDLLRQELSDHLVDGPQERYQLDWPGKREALFAANAPIAKTLRPAREESVHFNSTQNLFIEGDNLDALKLLQETYLNKVKMIYIDPPYNTGNDFIYEDDFAETTQEFLKRSNQLDEQGNRLVANTDSNGRFHSDWLSMMFSRLRLARSLLRSDGVIFIQIDETEIGNLRKVCDEVFGGNNFLNLITVKTKVAGVSGSHQGGSLQNNTEYIVAYARSRDEFSIVTVPTKKQNLMDYINIMKISGKSWKYTNVLVSPGETMKVGDFLDGAGQSIQVYEHSSPVIKSIRAIADEEFEGDLERAYLAYFHKVFRTTNAQTSIRQRVLSLGNVSSKDLLSIEYVPGKGRHAGELVKMYYRGPSRELFAWLKDVVDLEDEKLVKKEFRGTLWDDIDYNNLTKEGDIAFPNGKKPIRIMMDLQAMSCGPDDIVMDFFAGSSSTAHAVMQLNADDGGNRRFIMVQMPEKCAEISDAFRAGYATIAELSKERIRRAGTQVLAGNKRETWNQDIGFRVLKVDSSNLSDAYYTPDSIQQNELSLYADVVKPDRHDEDLLFQILIDWGIELSLPFRQEEVLDRTVYFVDEDAVMACFAAHITEDLVVDLAARRPLRAVFRDSGFASDSVRINVEQIFKQMSPDTEVKTV